MDVCPGAGVSGRARIATGSGHTLAPRALSDSGPTLCECDASPGTTTTYAPILVARGRQHSLRLGDYRRVALAAMEHVDHAVALLTITPPGHADLAPDPELFAAWNRTAAARWSLLDRRVKGYMRRQGLKVRPLLRIAQRQRRGLDHLHLVLAAEPRDRLAIAAYVRLLKELGPEHGFGFVDDPYKRRRSPRTGKLQTMVFDDPRIAARYLVGRYLVESPQLEALVAGADHSFRPLWVTPTLTKLSGCTVRRLRRVRHAYFVTAALDQGSRPTLPKWWDNLGERVHVLRLLRPRALALAG